MKFSYSLPSKPWEQAYIRSMIACSSCKRRTLACSSRISSSVMSGTFDSSSDAGCKQPLGSLAEFQPRTPSRSALHAGRSRCPIGHRDVHVGAAYLRGVVDHPAAAVGGADAGAHLELPTVPGTADDDRVVVQILHQTTAPHLGARGREQSAASHRATLMRAHVEDRVDLL